MNVRDILEALQKGTAQPVYIHGRGHLSLALIDGVQLDLFLPQYRAHPLAFGRMGSVNDHHMFKVLAGSLILHMIGFAETGHPQANYSLLVEDAETTKNISPVRVVTAEMEAGDDYELLAGDLHEVEVYGSCLRLSIVTAKVEAKNSVLAYVGVQHPVAFPPDDIARSLMYAALDALDGLQRQKIQEATQ